jgi:hypothetical protein
VPFWGLPVYKFLISIRWKQTLLLLNRIERCYHFGESNFHILFWGQANFKWSKLAFFWLLYIYELNTNTNLGAKTKSFQAQPQIGSKTPWWLAVQYVPNPIKNAMNRQFLSKGGLYHVLNLYVDSLDAVRVLIWGYLTFLFWGHAHAHFGARGGIPMAARAWLKPCTWSHGLASLQH